MCGGYWWRRMLAMETAVALLLSLGGRGGARCMDE